MRYIISLKKIHKAEWASLMKSLLPITLWLHDLLHHKDVFMLLYAVSGIYSTLDPTLFLHNFLHYSDINIAKNYQYNTLKNSVFKVDTKNGILSFFCFCSVSKIRKTNFRCHHVACKCFEY